MKSPEITVGVAIDVGLAKWEEDVGRWMFPISADQDFGNTIHKF